MLQRLCLFTLAAGFAVSTLAMMACDAEAKKPILGKRSTSTGIIFDEKDKKIGKGKKGANKSAAARRTKGSIHTGAAGGKSKNVGDSKLSKELDKLEGDINGFGWCI